MPMRICQAKRELDWMMKRKKTMEVAMMTEVTRNIEAVDEIQRELRRARENFFKVESLVESVRAGISSVRYIARGMLIYASHVNFFLELV